MASDELKAKQLLQEEAVRKEQLKQQEQDWLAALDAREKHIATWRSNFESSVRERDLQFSIESLKNVTTEFLSSFEVLTLQAHPTRNIKRVLGLVKGVGKQQGGLFSFKSQQGIYEGSFHSAHQELILEAASMGANAVLGVMSMVNSNTPTESTITGGSQRSVETVILYGTAVVLE